MTIHIGPDLGDEVTFQKIQGNRFRVTYSFIDYDNLEAGKQTAIITIPDDFLSLSDAAQQRVISELAVVMARELGIHS